MPSDAPHLASDRPVAGPLLPFGSADAAGDDEPLIGHECALPWLQRPSQAADVFTERRGLQ